MSQMLPSVHWIPTPSKNCKRGRVSPEYRATPSKILLLSKMAESASEDEDHISEKDTPDNAPPEKHEKWTQSMASRTHTADT